MADLFFEWITLKFLEDLTIGPKVGANVHPAHVASLTQPSYPLITVERRQSGEVDPHGPFQDWPLVVSCWSVDSFDEAWGLAEAVKTILHRTQYAASAGGWVVRLTETPTQHSDNTERVVYWVQMGFEVAQVG